MKKKLIIGSVVCLITLTSIVNLQYSQRSDNSKVSLKNIVAVANAESDTYNCPGGSPECLRIDLGNNKGSIVYYKK